MLGFVRSFRVNMVAGKIQIHPPHQAGVFYYTRGGDTMANRSSRWRRVRGMAYDRDRKARADCWWCGQPIDYFVPASSTPDSWEGDHKIPVSRAPELELDLTNIAASHRRCNRARGDGTNGENVIGMQSRIW